MEVVKEDSGNETETQEDEGNLFEMEEDVKPEGEMVSLTKEQYFGLLVAQS